MHPAVQAVVGQKLVCCTVETPNSCTQWTNQDKSAQILHKPKSTYNEYYVYSIDVVRIILS